MLRINTLADFHDALTKIRTSPSTLEDKAERFMELYLAVTVCEARTADGRYMLFSYMTKEYRMARWFFRTAIAMAYPDVNPSRVYGRWIGSGQTVHEVVSDVRLMYGTEYDIWDKFIDM